MGYFRFMLAAIVAYSHVMGKYLPLNLGVSAVVAFYFLSGYLMAHSFEAFRARSRRPTRSFYIDRFFRIFPSFWLVFVGTLAILSLTGRDWSQWATLGEFLLLPYHVIYMFGSTNVLLPTWSLSAEIAFYLLLPFLALFSTRWLAVLVFVLLAGQMVVFSVPGTVAEALFAGDTGACVRVTTEVFCERNLSDVLGYRWLPFVLVYFALGMLVFRLKTSGGKAVGLFVTANFVFLLAADGLGWLRHGYVDDQLWGAILFLPMAFMALGRLSGPNDSLNVTLGKMAYPLFLTHWAGRYLVADYVNDPWQGLAMFVLALMAAVVVMMFQDRIDRARYRIRGFGKSTKPAVEGAGSIEQT